jgi:hypothetical protein
MEAHHRAHQSRRRKQKVKERTMCPLCLASAGVVMGSVVSTGGLTAIALKFLRKNKSDGDQNSPGKLKEDQFKERVEQNDNSSNAKTRSKNRIQRRFALRLAGRQKTIPRQRKRVHPPARRTQPPAPRTPLGKSRKEI